MKRIKPWLLVIKAGLVQKSALVICEMCNWHYQPKTRNGIARAIKLHRNCGFTGDY